MAHNFQENNAKASIVKDKILTISELLISCSP